MLCGLLCSSLEISPAETSVDTSLRKKKKLKTDDSVAPVTTESAQSASASHKLKQLAGTYLSVCQ